MNRPSSRELLESRCASIGAGRKAGKKIVPLLVLAVVPVIAGMARADHHGEKPVRPFEVGVFAGGHIFEKLHGLGRETGAPEDFSPKSGVALGLRLGWNLNKYFGLEGEGMLSPTRSRDDSTSIMVLGYRAHLIVNFLPGSMVRPFALVGGGGMNSSPGSTEFIPKDNDSEVHVGLGAKYSVSDLIGLRLEGRVIAPPAVLPKELTIGDESDFEGLDYEVLLSAYVALGGKAPPPPPAAPPPDPDSDRDGVSGPADKCPDAAEDRDGFEDADGCPDPDNDGDGIADAVDKCPLKAETKNGIDDDDGCPEEDTDNDGIVGSADKCPEAPETRNSYQDDDGCPDEVPAAVKKFTGVIEGITFKTKSAEIVKGSDAVLDRAVAVLKEYPDVKLEINGHTDNVGKPEFNKDLSQRRAEAVKAYFVAKGIGAERLTTIGHGMEVPIGDNKTAAGKAKNRRTEFKLVSGN